MTPYLPVIVAAKFNVFGQDILSSARTTSTNILTLTLVGHTLAVGDKTFIALSGGGAAPSGIYAVTAVAGNDVSFGMGATYTNPSSASTKWKKAGALTEGIVTLSSATSSATAVGFTVATDAGLLGSLGGAITVASATAAAVTVVATAGVKNAILLVKSLG